MDDLKHLQYLNIFHIQLQDLTIYKINLKLMFLNHNNDSHQNLHFYQIFRLPKTSCFITLFIKYLIIYLQIYLKNTKIFFFHLNHRILFIFLPIYKQLSFLNLKHLFSKYLDSQFQKKELLKNLYLLYQLELYYCHSKYRLN